MAEALATGICSVKTVGEEARPAWDRFVAHHPGATFFHQWGYRRAVESCFGHRPHYLLAERDGEVAGILPLFELKSRLFGHSLVSLPFAVYGGAVAVDDEVHAAIYAHAKALARTRRADYLELRYLEPSGLTGEGSDLYVTFRKQISGDDDANLKQIPRKQRRMVRQGPKRGLTHRTGPQELDAVWALYAESVHRLGTPVYPRRWFRTLQEVFGHDCHCLTVRHQGRPVAGVLTFFFKDQVLPYYAGSLAEFRRLAPNDFMYWQLMRIAAERGVRLFDFGRSKRGTGAFDFKVHWGFEPAPLPYLYHVPGGGPRPEVNPTAPGFRRKVEAWKRLPLPVANRLGPWIIRSIP